MSIERHSVITDPLEKHLPKGFEVPTKGALLAGAMPNVEKTNSPSMDGNILVSDSTENTGIKWIRDFVFRVVSNIKKIVMLDTNNTDEYCGIYYDTSTDTARYGSNSEVGGNVILISDGQDGIEFDGSNIHNHKPTGINKKPSENSDLDINGVERISNVSSESVIKEFVKKFVFTKTTVNSNWFTVAEIEFIGASTNVYSAGWVELSVVQANDEGSGEYGYIKYFGNFQMIDGSLSTHSEGQRTDSSYPRVGFSISGNTIIVRVRVSTGTGTGGSNVFGKIEIGVGGSEYAPANWDARKV